jgi:hypothetical protein
MQESHKIRRRLMPLKKNGGWFRNGYPSPLFWFSAALFGNEPLLSKSIGYDTTHHLYSFLGNMAEEFAAYLHRGTQWPMEMKRLEWRKFWAQRQMSALGLLSGIHVMTSCHGQSCTTFDYVAR